MKQLCHFSESVIAVTLKSAESAPHPLVSVSVGRDAERVSPKPPTARLEQHTTDG